jgi:Fe-S-cluster containining protein
MADLRDAQPRWLSSILLDATALTATVTLHVPVGEGANPTLYEEVVPIDERLPEYMREALNILAKAGLRYVRERESLKGEPKCVGCTSACCGGVYTKVQIDADDVVRLGREDAERGVDFYPEGPRIDGFVGNIRLVPWTGEGTARPEGATETGPRCLFLDPSTSACTVYDKRPTTCRTYVASSCQFHEQASEPLVQIRRGAFAATE